jgi:hypothetical protein
VNAYRLLLAELRSNFVAPSIFWLDIWKICGGLCSRQGSHATMPVRAGLAR